MKSLEGKLHLFMMILVLFTNTMVTGVTCWPSYLNSMTRAEQTLSYLTGSYKQYLGSELDEYRREVEEVAKSAILNSADAAVQQQYLQEQAKQEGLVYFMLADSQGNTQQDRSMSQEKWFQPAGGGTAYIANSVRSRRDDGLTVTTGVPAGDGQVMYGETTYDSSTKIFDSIKISGEGYAFVISQDGKTVPHSIKDTVANPVDYARKVKTGSSITSMAELYRRTVTGETGAQYMVYQSQRRQVGSTQISGPEKWAIAAFRPINQITQDLYRTLLINVGTTVLFQLITLVAAVVLTARLAKPIEKATEGIKLFAQGNLQIDVPQMKSRDEVVHLSSALGHTVQQLRLYIQDISHVLDEVSHSNLAAEGGVEHRGDFAPIRGSLARVLNSLSEVFEGVSQTAYQVSTGAEEMTLGAQNLAQNPAEQASTVESLSTSLQGVFERVKSNASHTTSVEGLPNEVVRFVQQDSEQMNRVLQSIRDIDHTTKEILNIVKVINGIAARTNILVLGAAIEAARADLAGKGFAVVADKVRSLTSKSAQATTTISDLVQRVIDSVGKGMVVIDQIAKSLDQIVEKNGQANELINRIAEASNEQAKMITELDNGMMRVSSVTQTNSVIAEESTVTSGKLPNRSKMLEELMKRSQIKSDTIVEDKE